MPRLYNRHHRDAPPDAVYIGRGTPWGNPFIINSSPDLMKLLGRDTVCFQFERLVENDPEFKQKIKDELRGKDLVCSCYPLRCHGDTLLRIANE